jgi:hypothetical protein
VILDTIPPVKEHFPFQTDVNFWIFGGKIFEQLGRPGITYIRPGDLPIDPPAHISIHSYRIPDYWVFDRSARWVSWDVVRTKTEADAVYLKMLFGGRE